MPNSQDPASPAAAFEALPNPSSFSKRLRPPDPDAVAAEAERVPLRIEAGGKGRRRESKLAIKNLFGRNKGAVDGDRALASPREALQKLGGLRASLADLSNWPYSLNLTQGHRSEISLPAPKSPVGQSLRHKKSASGVRPPPSPDGLAAWNPPPLFQAYPQAIKHAHLPACTAPAEVVLRMHYHKSTPSFGSMLGQGVLSPRIVEESTDEKKSQHRRKSSGSASKLEWTSKVYILVTSGYLLQYAGEGSFDRLPERVLHLGKDSAAFASDVIPGRHWVLQVSSVAEPDRANTSHSSIRARLPFRGQERRHSSTMLMVFDSAEDMDAWIVTLRREIEALGGRKVLSETGKPRLGDHDPRLKSQTSQRTLVVKNSSRFSRVMTPDQPRARISDRSSSDIHLDPSQDACAQSFDDTSTVSLVSQDGRQLDTLRDSMNRLSYMSSGQRTGVTSAGSSPACSPIRDSFPERESLTLEHPQLEEQPKPRLRPNATAINDRRQSLQTINHVFELRVAAAQSLRPGPPLPNFVQSEGATPFVSGPQSTPNLNAPHGASNRHSLAKGTTIEPTRTSGTLLAGRLSSRKPPPSALSINPRPLSLVEDQPSPDLSPDLSPPNRVRSATESAGSPPSSAAPTPPLSPSSSPRVERGSPGSENHDSPTHDSNAAWEANGLEASAQNPPRPFTSESGSSNGSADSSSKEHRAALRSLQIPRPKSSLDTYAETQVPGQPAAKQEPRPRRLSFPSPQQSERPALFGSPPPPRARTPSLKPVRKSSQHLRVDSLLSPGLLQRRSMSQLAEGPPPAPPPNRALPPIPRKPYTVTVVPPPGFI